MTDRNLLEIARGRDGAAGEQVEAYVLRSATPTSRSSTVRWSRSRSRRSTVSGYGCSSTTGRATWPARSIRRSSPRRWPRRDNAGFGTQDEALGLPEPADVEAAVAPISISGDALLAIPRRRRSRSHSEVEAATRRADPRVRGVESAPYGDGAVEVAVASSLGIGRQPGARCARSRRSRWPARARRPRPDTGSPWVGRSATSTSPRLGVTRPSGRPGCSVPASPRPAGFPSSSILW